MNITSEDRKPKFLTLPNPKGIFQEDKVKKKKPKTIKLGIRLTERIMFAKVSI